MAREPAHPGPRDGSRPLAWALGGACVALIILVIKLSVAPAVSDNAFVYVLCGALDGYLLHLLRRRRQDRRR